MDSASLENCTKIEIILEILYSVVGFFPEGFGTMLRNHIDLSNFDSFSSRQVLFNVHLENVILGSMNSYCEHLKPQEKKLHQMFEKLSNVIGFSALEAMSLYEIPAMLSDPASDTGRSSDELKLGSMGKSFFYTRCKFGFKYEDLRICANAWINHVENILNGNQSTGN